MKLDHLYRGAFALACLALPAWPQQGRTGPADLALVGRLACIERIADQANGTCLLASSTPTFGQLLPYPGTGNTFFGTAFVGGGENNLALGSWSTVGGGRQNLARSFSTVGGGEDNVVTTAGGHCVIGGGHSNTADGRAVTIGGGEYNRADGTYATIAGGRSNRVQAPHGTIGGGFLNTTGPGYFSTIGGGYDNSASQFSTIGGGQTNTASGISAIGGGALNNARYGSAVAGGVLNQASGAFSAVSGGYFNGALGDYSFAAGRRARAQHVGAFVWADSQDLDKPSSTADEFNVYASGGARFFSNSAATTGVLLAPGGGSWTAVSSRDRKENVEPVDVGAVLDQVLDLPISTWNYREQSDEIRHMGPMAQDFYTAFELGLGETTIDTIDPDGVALAAIQGLHALVEEKDEQLAAHQERISELEARLDRLEERLANSDG